MQNSRRHALQMNRWPFTVFTSGGYIVQADIFILGCGRMSLFRGR